MPSPKLVSEGNDTIPITVYVSHNLDFEIDMLMASLQQKYRSILKVIDLIYTALSLVKLHTPIVVDLFIMEHAYIGTLPDGVRNPISSPIKTMSILKNSRISSPTKTMLILKKTG